MMNGEKGFNVGDLLHVLEIAVLLISVGIGYEKFQITLEMVEKHTQQVNRIEHYLSSKDPNYWRLTSEPER